MVVYFDHRMILITCRPHQVSDGLLMITLYHCVYHMQAMYAQIYSFKIFTVCELCQKIH